VRHKPKSKKSNDQYSQSESRLDSAASKKSDYLAERRKIRQDFSKSVLSSETSSDKLAIGLPNSDEEIPTQEQIKSIEKTAYFRKHMISGTDEVSMNSIEANEKVDDAIFTAIKAKLKLMESDQQPNEENAEAEEAET
jgi:hypothetical protein